MVPSQLSQLTHSGFRKSSSYGMIRLYVLLASLSWQERAHHRILADRSRAQHRVDCDFHYDRAVYARIHINSLL